MNQRVAGLIPSQGTCLGGGPAPQWGYVRDNHTLMFLSLLKKKKRFRNTLKRKKAGYQIKISIHFFCDCTGRDHTGLSALLDGTFSRQGLFLQLSLISSYTMPGRVKVREYNKCLLNEWAKSQIKLILSELPFFKNNVIYFLERGSEGEREGEKHQSVVASYTPPTGDLACNPGTCPD